jgi:dynein heavy chain
MEEFYQSDFPMTPANLELHVKRLTAGGRDVLTKKWMNDISNLFVEHKCSWTHMVPQTTAGSLTVLEKFFGSTCSLMSILMRKMVMSSLEDIVAVFRTYGVSPYIYW